MLLSHRDPYHQDPYLWVHLIGLAAVPLWLDICLLGLAAGTPRLPVWTEMAFLIGVGVLPVLWMQLRKPFCIFCLVLLSLKPNRLSDERRQLLRVFQGLPVKIVAALVPLPLVWILWKLYLLAPIASGFTPFASSGRAVGLGVAAITFLLANLFVQVPASVGVALLYSPQAMSKLPPCPVEQVRRAFTLVGLPVNGILPDLQKVSEPLAVSVADDLEHPGLNSILSP